MIGRPAGIPGSCYLHPPTAVCTAHMGTLLTAWLSLLLTGLGWLPQTSTVQPCVGQKESLSCHLISLFHETSALS